MFGVVASVLLIGELPDALFRPSTKYTVVPPKAVPKMHPKRSRVTAPITKRIELFILVLPFIVVVL
jgi:hypothetical protein